MMSFTDNSFCDVLLVGYEGQENLGLRSVAAFLEHANIRVEILPLQVATREQILTRIKQTDPKLIGFSLIFQRMLEDYSQIISFLRDNGVNAHITVGGHFPTFEYEYMLLTIPGLDSVVRHEGEETLFELYQQLDSPKKWSLIKGLAFRKDGNICTTAIRPLIADLDTLPFPTRMHKGATHRGIGIRSIAGSRGCYYDCTFCSIHEFYRRKGPTRRTRTPKKLVQEMESLFENHGVRIFIFQDDDIFMRGKKHRKWLHEFLDELETKNLHDKILWRISCRIDDVDKHLLNKMKSYGLISVYLGIESGSEDGLSTFNKRYKVSDIIRTLSLLKELELEFEFGFMLFEPYSTHKTIRENINFLKTIGDYGDSLVHFCKMSPYAGTAIAKKLIKENRMEGTVACPDYRFLDPRIDLLQTFFSQTFNFRNFDDRGLVERLRFAKFDACVVEKYFSEKYDVQSYRTSIRELIKMSNESALETMSLAANFTAAYSFEKIIDHWHVLEEIRQKELRFEQIISNTLDELMNKYGFQAALDPSEIGLASVMTT
jgi:radical SAM superfamily enzyme YgiQ (UPF0313 family)